jgi:hypothetical protein
MPGRDTLFRLLGDSPGGDVFNPWQDRDPDFDHSDQSPKMRRENLRHYLDQRAGFAKWVFVAEAVGFRGGKFSGIAMTCERQLPMTDLPHHRTSSQTIPLRATDRCGGVLEPTAMIVARALAGASVDPRAVVLWNTFAWHPHKPQNRLTNRTPTPTEVQHGLRVLRAMLGLFEGARVIAIGKTCQRAMSDQLGMNVPAVRHPANGGATEFTRGVQQLLR